jgi:hypothetical protein
MTRGRTGVLAVLAVAGLGTAGASPAVAETTVKDYVKGLSGYNYDATWSAADRVPEASTRRGDYQMIGIPDGLGARAFPASRRGPSGALTFMNHELGNTTTSEPSVGGPLNRGAFVSALAQNGQGDVLTGRRAYDKVFVENTLVGPAAEADNPATPEVEGNNTPGFGRFCSGGLWGREVGFDRDIYLTGEESGGSQNFDGKGGEEVAIFNNELHALPDMLHFNWENVIVLPNTGRKTVIIGLEDGPSGANSQLYMWVGQKNPNASDVLDRNGLLNGDNYVLKGDTNTSEVDFQSGSADFHWVKLPEEAKQDTDTQLEARVDALGAFGFVRIEDGAGSKTHSGEAFFNTTGGSTGNMLGRIYRFRQLPDGGVRLTILQNADTIVAAGGDTALSPDNMDINDQGQLMVQEDGTAQTRPVMAAKGRDGSIWSFQTEGPNLSPQRVAELTPPGRDGVPVPPGEWETSGIIDASAAFGPGAWLLDVQAHPPTAMPAPFTVEDGQLGVLRAPQ